MKKLINILFCLTMLAGINSCASSTTTSDENGTDNVNLTDYEYVKYDDIATLDNVNLYQAEVKKDSKNNDDPTENGIINCPYYTLLINDKEVPVYSTRCASGLHSFAWIDVLDDKSINLNVTINLKNYHKNVVVLPESRNVAATLSSSVVKATINNLGSYSFAFDKKVAETLTIYIAKKENLNNDKNYEVVTLEPKTYTTSETDFSSQNTIYYFKAGRYTISSINIPSNSDVYFESGCYFNVVPENKDTDRNSGIRSTGTKNINIYGRAIFDYSINQGGDGKIKGVVGFTNVDNVVFSGIIVINSNSWSVCFTDSTNVTVEKIMILGYRTYSDGVMLSDCQDCLVRNCFVRTGDDAIEAKSTGTKGSKNLIYEYNDVWTDKARAYGCIYECNNEMDNIIFRHNSVGFALATWTDYLGCIGVWMGNKRTTTWGNIHFEDIEIYSTAHAVINITLQDDLSNGRDGGIAKNIYFKNITVHRAYGYALKIKVMTGSTLGKVYVDNLRYNDTDFNEDSLKDSTATNIVTASSKWANSNLYINTLND